MASTHAAAHEGESHAETDSVTYTPQQERRAERRTLAASSDLEASAARAGAATQGRWSPRMDWPVVGIHAALMPTGDVVAYDNVGPEPTSAYPDHDRTRAAVFDPDTGSVTRNDVMHGVNVFCSGLAHLVNGTLLLAGGNADDQDNGIDRMHVFDHVTGAWSIEQQRMTIARWYPTVTPLANGEMLIASGGDIELNQHEMHEVRRLNGTVRDLPGARLGLPFGEYPWIDVAPDGRAFVSGPGAEMRSFNTAGNGSVVTYPLRQGAFWRNYGSHALYDVGKILVSGGARPAVSSAETIDINLPDPAPVVRATDSMQFERRQHNLTTLPDGSVLATGGLSGSNNQVDLSRGILPAELWDPDTGQWTTLASMEVTRQYHSTALLLADGRVLSAGGGVCGECKDAGYLAPSAEIFTPPYLFDGNGDLADRPRIAWAPPAIGYGGDGSFEVNTPEAGSIDEVSLMRLGAVTHGVNMDQRRIPLNFTADADSLTVQPPANANIAPPGPYMLFLIDDAGVPSVAAQMSVAAGVRPDPPPQTTPAVPSITDTDPDSPANDNAPEVKGSAAAGTTVEIWSTSGCSGTPLASGSAAAFSGSGITVNVPGDSTTSLRATARMGTGPRSGCSPARSYTEDSTPPATPSITDTDPDSPSSDSTPEVKGSATAGSTVRIYSTAGCTGTPLATGSAATFNGSGITVNVPSDATTSLRATAADAVGNVSGCSGALSYTEDSTPPAVPSITDTDPDSPSSDSAPEVKGSAAAGSTIRLYSTAGCTGAPLATGSAATFNGSGITVHVPGDATTNLRATATDSAGNASGCSGALSYTEDSTPPATPSITDTDPDSPSSDSAPEVKGNAEAGATVEVFGTSDCSGPALATGTAAGFSSPGLTVTVPEDATTDLSARARDAAGLASGCSAPLSYTEDSSAPEAPLLTGTNPASPAGDNAPEVKGSAPEGTTVRIYGDPACDGEPLGTGSAAELAGGGITVAVPTDAEVELAATATDGTSLSSACSQPLTYREDSTPPRTQIDDLSVRGSSVTASFSSEPGARFECALDGGTRAACESPVAFSGLTKGRHYLEVRPRDAAGNAGASARGDFEVVAEDDRSPAARPETWIEDHPPRFTKLRRARFVFGSSDRGSAFRCWIDGKRVPCGERLTLRVRPGRHRLSVAAVDAAGRADQTPAAHAWKVRRRGGESSRRGAGAREGIGWMIARMLPPERDR